MKLTMKNNNPTNFKKKVFSFLLAFSFILGLNYSSKACSPLNVPVLVSQSIVGSNLILNWSSNTPYHCPDVIDVEIACNTATFSGLAAYTYTSGVVTGAVTTYTYPPMSIPIGSLCPGTVYKFRARERNNSSMTSSAWSANFTFTTPGVFIPPTGNLTATPPVITLCPQGQSTLGMVCTNCCGNPPYTYTWTPAASLSCSTCANPVATPSATTIYTLNAKGGQLGCWGITNTVQVTVITTPASIGVASSTPTLCSGQTGTVGITTYSGAIQWQSAPSATGPWTNVTGATTGSFTTVPLNTTTFYQAVVIGCGPTLTSNVTPINVTPTPTITTLGSTVCMGTAGSLSASGATSYVWSAGAMPTGVNTASALPVSTTVYTVTGNTSGCTGTAVATVSVNPMPVPTATNNGPVCTGGSLVLGSTGGGTYSWSGPNGFVSALQNPTIVPTTTLNQGVYTVLVTLNGCSATATTNVVITIPTTSASNTGPYCATFPVMLSAATGGIGYMWSGPGGWSSAVQNPTIPASVAAMSGIYTVTVNLGSCTAMATTSVTVNALPTPMIGSNSPVCVGKPINFTGSGGTSYSWFGPGLVSSTQNPTINSSQTTNTGTYTLTVTDANGCINKTTTNVLVNALPVVAASGQVVCQNSTANLTSSGGVTYSWTGPNGFTSSSQNANIPNAQPISTGQYQVFITDANTCTNIAVANVIVNPQPTPNIQTNSPICIQNVLSLAGSGGVSYAWTGPNGFFSTAQSPTVLVNTTAYTGNYNLTITDANGCTASTQASATVNPVPNVTIVSSKNTGCPPLCVTYTAVASTSSPIQNYSWNLGNGAGSNTPNEQACYPSAGIYTVGSTVTDANGCSNSTTYTVQTYPKPVADFNYAPIKPIEAVDEVTFTDASFSANVATWNWYFMNTAQATSNLQNPHYTYAEAGQYAIALVVKSDHGCIDTIIKSILVGEDYGIYVPTAFSPNGDGLNDVFHAKGFGISKYEMQIFDRWGEKVFTSTDINEAWDGTSIKGGNKTIAEGVFTWRVKLTNVFGKSKELTGHVTLIK